MSVIPEPGPRRTYLVAVFVNIAGFGLIVTAMTLYGTRALHLSTAKTSLVLTTAGLAGLLAGVPMRNLADRRGPREMLRLSQRVHAGGQQCGHLARRDRHRRRRADRHPTAYRPVPAPRADLPGRRGGPEPSAEVRAAHGSA